MNVRARSCSLFSSFKKGKAFSLRCLSPLCSPAVGAGQTQMAALGMFRVAGVVSQREETGLFFFCVCRYPCINNTAWDASMRLEYFCNAKGQRDFKSTLAFLASHEAYRRMAVLYSTDKESTPDRLAAGPVAERR